MNSRYAFAPWLNSYRNRLALLIGGFVLLMLLVLSLFVDKFGTARLTAERGNQLLTIARGVSQMLAQTILEREREVLLLSRRTVMSSGALDGDETRSELDRIKASYQHYAWIGVTDASGKIMAAADGLLEGQDASARPWFIHGQQKSFVGDAHEALLLAKKLPRTNANEPLRFVDFSSPIFAQDGTLRGVVATHASWDWVAEIISNFLPQDVASQGVEAFIVNQQGAFLHPYAWLETPLPGGLPEDGLYAALEWHKEGKFLTAVVDVPATAPVHLGWRVVLRQPLQQALLTVHELEQILLYMGLLMSAVATLLAYLLARRFSRPLEQIVAAAGSVEQGNESMSIKVSSGSSEIIQLSEALEAMLKTLVERKQELFSINQTLEQRVQSRTEELAQANRELEHLVRHDVLTGLLNRRAFIELLQAEFQRMKRTQQGFALMLLDIDRFKQVNDQYGHDAGDAVLQHVARTVQAAVRSTDWVARLGGEEFVVLMPNTAETAISVAEKVREAVEMSHAPIVEQVTVSIGVSLSASSQVNEDVIVKLADSAMYQAKTGGRNQVVGASEK